MWTRRFRHDREQKPTNQRRLHIPAFSATQQMYFANSAIWQIDVQQVMLVCKILNRSISQFLFFKKNPLNYSVTANDLNWSLPDEREPEHPQFLLAKRIGFAHLGLNKTDLVQLFSHWSWKRVEWPSWNTSKWVSDAN